MKTCTKCKAAKPLTDFYKDKRRPDGATSECKVCARAMQQAWREANPSKYAATILAWRAAHRDKVKAFDAAWRKRNAEKEKARHLTYREKHLEACRARKRTWDAANPHMTLATVRRRQAVKLGARCDCCQTEDAKTNFCLVYAMGRKLGLHVDHVKPLAKGGRHCLNNLQYLTPTENKRKGAKWQEPATSQGA